MQSSDIYTSNVIVATDHHTGFSISHLYNFNKGILAYNSSYPFPTQPSAFPALATIPNPPAIQSAAAVTAAPLITHHLLLAFLSFPHSTHPFHLAIPHTKCPAAMLTSAVYPVQAKAGCFANPWLTNPSPTPDEPPSYIQGKRRFVNACPSTNGARI
jgi:hypothetical protein